MNDECTPCDDKYKYNYNEDVLKPNFAYIALSVNDR